MPSTVAAGFTMTYGTSMHALKQRAQLQAGETLLVLGAGGGVGLAAVEIGKQMNATVIAAASSTEKVKRGQKRRRRSLDRLFAARSAQRAEGHRRQKRR